MWVLRFTIRCLSISYTPIPLQAITNSLEGGNLYPNRQQSEHGVLLIRVVATHMTAQSVESHRACFQTLGCRLSVYSVPHCFGDAPSIFFWPSTTFVTDRSAAIFAERSAPAVPVDAASSAVPGCPFCRVGGKAGMFCRSHSHLTLLIRARRICVRQQV